MRDAARRAEVDERAAAVARDVGVADREHRPGVDGLGGEPGGVRRRRPQDEGEQNGDCGGESAGHGLLGRRRGSPAATGVTAEVTGRPRRADDLVDVAVRRAEVTPRLLGGALDLGEQLDPGGGERAPGALDVRDPQPDDRRGAEEAVVVVGRAVDVDLHAALQPEAH